MGFLIDDVVKNACRYAATIAAMEYQGFERGFLPPMDSNTATVTFIKFEGKTFAVTARHVIDGLDSSRRSNSSGYMCLQKPGVGIGGPFLTPLADHLGRTPDIAICPVDDSLPHRIGKVAFEIDRNDDAIWPVKHAVAVGFPTGEKGEKSDVASKRLALVLPCVSAVAEGLDSPGTNDQIQFHSELHERPNFRSLSGISGGPVFWSDGTRSGLIGFVKEALDLVPKDGEETFYSEPKVNFICQRVDFSIFEGWIEHVNANWTLERAKICAILQNEREEEKGKLP